MLNGSELTVAITAVLVGAVCVGFLLHWLWVVLAPRPASGKAQLDEMAGRLHDADLAREEAEAARQAAEALAAQRGAEAAERTATLKDRLEGELAAREAELQRELAEMRAELETMRDGLGAARRRMSELEVELEARSGGEETG